MTPFTRSVYAVVAAIPAGRVTSYGAVAAILGRPRAPRAVGGALSTIPDALDLPWWRVISCSGRISTSSIHHTAQIQRALLEDEGVRLGGTGRVDWDRYEWDPNDADLERVLGMADSRARQHGGTGA
jgi:methylated-DNA-protein-cysteine methyltransferase-like protein